MKRQDLNEDEDRATEPFRNGKYSEEELHSAKFAREFEKDYEQGIKLFDKNARDLESLGVSHRDIPIPSKEDTLSEPDSSYSDAESVSTESDQRKLFTKPGVKHVHDNLISAKDQVDTSQNAKFNDNVTDPNNMFSDPQDFVNNAEQDDKQSRQLFRKVAEDFTDVTDRPMLSHTYVDQYSSDSSYVTPLSESESSEDPVDPSEPESSVGPVASGSSRDFLSSESSEEEEILVAKEDSAESSSKKQKLEDDSDNRDDDSDNGDDDSDNGDNGSDNGGNGSDNGGNGSDNGGDDFKDADNSNRDGLIKIKLNIMNLSLILFLIGILGFVLNRKNIILMLISIEIMLLSITFLILISSLSFDDILGQTYAIYIVTIAGAESAIGLGILVAFYRLRGSIAIDYK
ncbi:MAG: hypothetical protein Q9167_006448 [Letrouitia subvulpina]